MFISIFVGSAAMQFLTVQFVGIVFKTVPLDGDDWAICLILGLFSLPFGILGRFLPPFDFLNQTSNNSKVLPVRDQSPGKEAMTGTG
jgi:hypothetical protein